MSKTISVKVRIDNQEIVINRRYEAWRFDKEKLWGVIRIAGGEAILLTDYKTRNSAIRKASTMNATWASSYYVCELEVFDELDEPDWNTEWRTQNKITSLNGVVELAKEYLDEAKANQIDKSFDELRDKIQQELAGLADQKDAGSKLLKEAIKKYNKNIDDLDYHAKAEKQAEQDRLVADLVDKE